MSFTNHLQLRLTDRIFWMAILVVACFVAVLILPSQSRASYPSYFLSLLMLFSFARWVDVFSLSLVRLIGVCLVWMGCSVLWSTPLIWGDAISIWIRILLVFLFVVAVAECQFRGQLQRWMASAMTVVGAMVVVAAVYVFHIENPLDGRLNGLGQLDTHVIAALVYGVVLLFVLQFARTSKGWASMLAGIVVVLIAYAIVMSDSRNAWVSVGIGAVVYFLANTLRDVRQWTLCLLAGSVLLAVTLLVASNTPTLSEVFFPRGDSFRLTIWQQAIERIGGSWLWGRGILTSDDQMIGTIEILHSHSLYLSLVHQSGVIGLTMFALVLLQAFSVLLRNYANHDAKLSLSMLVMALSAYVLDGHELVDKVGSSWFLIWFPVGIAVGLQWARSNSELKNELFGIDDK